MASKELQERFKNYEDYVKRKGIDEKVIDAYCKAAEYCITQEKDIEYGLTKSARAKELMETWVKKDTKFGSMWELEKEFFGKREVELLNKYYNMLLVEARCKVLDSYFQYLERKRIPNERFYMPKRKHLIKLGLIPALQDMIDDKLDILSISMPPGTQKTTLEKFFNSAVIGWFPNDFNLFFSHSGDIARMYYDGVLDIVTNVDEYTWNEVFEGLQVTSTNAKMQQFNVGKYKPFPSVQTTSVGSENAGKVRASKFLLCDDLIGKLEEAMNKNTLDKLWSVYSVDARQRKLDGCKEIHIATRWSVHDVIGRLQRLYEGNDRCRFIAIPDIDEETGKSNFDYEYRGFTVEFFRDQELAMDDVSYRCLYKNQPIEREGLVFPEDKLRRYLSLPTREPDEILGQCDTKGKGTDFMVMPILYRYGDDYYCEATICNNSSDYESQYESLANMIVNHKVQTVDFERNAGGDRVALEVNKRVESKGWICNITDTPTETNKEARIYQCSNWIMQHILFKDKSQYTGKEDYGVMMNLLTGYSVTDKKQLDDVPDVFSNFALRRQGNRVVKVEVFDRNFFGL